MKTTVFAVLLIVSVIAIGLMLASCATSDLTRPLPAVPANAADYDRARERISSEALRDWCDADVLKPTWQEGICI